MDSLMFYSPSTRGFYDEAIHGPRTNTYPDPTWSRPTVSVTVAPGESVTLENGDTYTNSGDVAENLMAPDWSATHPQLSEPNPDTRIPLDARPVPRDVYVALFAAQELGAVIVPNENGDPHAVEPQFTDAELAASANLNRRALLQESDWVVLRAMDTGGTVPAAWGEYRQALRDLPTQKGFPHTIAWPTKPE